MKIDELIWNLFAKLSIDYPISNLKLRFLLAFAIIFKAGLTVDTEFRLNCCSFLTGSVESMCLLAVSPDGNWLAASGTSAGVHVYNVKRLKVSFEFSSNKQKEDSPVVIRPVGMTWKITRLSFLKTNNISCLKSVKGKQKPLMERN